MLVSYVDITIEDKEADRKELIRKLINQTVKPPMDALRDNKNKPRWSLLHFKSLEPMIRVLEYGAKKYSEGNYLKGHIPKEVLDSLMRHTTALMDGEINDPESGLPHIGFIQCNAMFYEYSTQKIKSESTPTTPIFIDSFQRTFPGSDKIVFELTDGRQFDFTEKQLIELIINNKTP